MGTAHKFDLNKHLLSTPGPGTYEEFKNIGKDVPSIILKGRLSPEKIDKNPGPGSYNEVNAFKAVRDKSPSF